MKCKEKGPVLLKDIEQANSEPWWWFLSLCFVFEMVSFCITQTGLKILGSDNPPTAVSQVGETTGLSYQEWCVEQSKAETQRKRLADLRKKQSVLREQYTYLNMPMAIINTAKELKYLQQGGVVRKNMSARLLVLIQEET